MEQIRIERILCPVDYSEYSDHGLTYALCMADVFEAELRLLHVVEIPVMPSYGIAGGADMVLPIQDFEQGAAEHMAELLKKCRARHPKTDGEVRTGSAFLEIINCARRCNAGLIVMGTHGRSALSHILMGSVAERVVRKAPCPVLTVKHPDHSFEMP